MKKLFLAIFVLSVCLLGDAFGLYCPAGQYGPWYSISSTCYDCPGGSTSYSGYNTSLTDCFCPGGFYATSDTGYYGVIKDENSTCSVCPDGAVTYYGEKYNYVNPDSFDGGYSYTVTDCKCSSNYYMNEGFTACLKCPDNSKGAYAASTSLLNCKCYAGYYMDETLATCVPCPNDGVSAAGSTSVTECYLSAGVHTDDTGTYTFSEACNYTE